ncbi:C40 family peptidase [Alicyclobacillus vulcanalis]|uniref:Peptidoglycan endopeptidase LytE n=1 Tax=Alicyclobacillus vulcanalis TaxID=252246 RepID=A0A1N7L2D4_9BACL|nr:LysM peptidoglycan-binding domain-containing C40 family peptidase [Alicyclobacillus vulcanalis]SIS68019.1 peptidoglycan endopeptidase LytE [Alicyclobacillus vulcanalis]
MRRPSAWMCTALTITFAALGQATVWASSEPQPTTYTVHQGDTLYRIATANHVPLSAVVLANPQLSNPNQIAPGETLTLPTPYIVQPGDTVYLIATSHHLTVSAILQANPGIQPLDLLVGETIYLPIPASNSAPTPPPATANPTSSTGPSASGSGPSSTTGTGQSATSAGASSTSSAGQPATSAGASSTSSAGQSATPVSQAQLRQAILTYAKSFLGTPYTWGGDTPQTGFDCSGFVEYVFAHFGIQLPRESHDQATVGTPVSMANLQPGDLLFFSDTDSNAALYANHVTHVGIYMGNGAMIESSSAHNGEGVVIVQNVFQNPYYVAHYYGARDVIGG